MGFALHGTAETSQTTRDPTLSQRVAANQLASGVFGYRPAMDWETHRRWPGFAAAVVAAVFSGIELKHGRVRREHAMESAAARLPERALLERPVLPAGPGCHTEA
jgi:hypothetical protein